MTGPVVGVEPTARQHSKIRRREYARQERRDAITLLLDRMDRGVILPAEKELLRQHVLEEQRLGDESRHAAATTTRALAEQREAADAAIRELEAERDQLAEELAVLRRQAIAGSPMPTRRRARHPRQTGEAA